jgi:subtilisin family serine protease
MKNLLFRSVAAFSLLALGHQACAQVVPLVQNVIDRQLEQVHEQVLERAVEQAQNQTLERTVDQVQTQVVDRTVEQVQSQAAERVVEQTTAVVDSLAVDRVTQQQVDNVQNQALEQVQNVVEQAQAQVAEQAQAQIERVQNQVDRAQQQVEQVQSQVIQLPAQTIERAQQAVIAVLPEVAAQVDGGTAVDVAAQVDSSGAVDVAAQVDSSAAVDVAGQVEADADPVLDDTAASAQQRQIVNNIDGTQAFVDITLEPGVRAVEFEWIMVVTPEQRARLDDEAAELLDYLTNTEPFALTEGELLTFTVPPDLDANDAIVDLVPDNMRELIDRNHIYDMQDDDSGSAPHGADASLLPLPMPAVCSEPLSIGMIDSAVDASHPVFGKRQSAIHGRSFVDTTLAQPAGHGTAVAGLFVGSDIHAEVARLRPLLPRASIFSAAVFHEQEGTRQGATVVRILEALDWLVSEQDVRVINMSLAGPPNRLLAQAVTAATAKGRVIVAAAGNEGPYAPERYPAAYADAIGVTAVGRDSAVFRFANQGEYIDYAALGVDVPTALDHGDIGPGSGTSLAAPIVSAFLACALAQNPDTAAALAALDKRVVDLGAPGPDPVYGRGLLHP